MELVNNENQEVNEQEVELTVVKKEGILTKVVNGTKKHGKKILTGILVAGAGIVAYTLGKKAGSKQDDSEEDLVVYDLDSEDIPDDEE